MARWSWFAVGVAMAGRVEAEPLRATVAAIGGAWITGHSSGERHAGAEVVLERDLADFYRAGAGLEVLEYRLNDDECFGSSGQLVGPFVTAGLRDPTTETVHVFIAGRFGVRGERMVPSCYPTSPIRYDSAWYTSLVAGADVGDGRTRVRVQVGMAYRFATTDSPVDVTAGIGVSF